MPRKTIENCTVCRKANLKVVGTHNKRGVTYWCPQCGSLSYSNPLPGSPAYFVPTCYGPISTNNKAATKQTLWSCSPETIAEYGLPIMRPSIRFTK